MKIDGSSDDDEFLECDEWSNCAGAEKGMSICAFI